MSSGRAGKEVAHEQDGVRGCCLQAFRMQDVLSGYPLPAQLSHHHVPCLWEGQQRKRGTKALPLGAGHSHQC